MFQNRRQNHTLANEQSLASGSAVSQSDPPFLVRFFFSVALSIATTKVCRRASINAQHTERMCHSCQLRREN